MKKIITLIILMVLFSCDNDDEKSTFKPRVSTLFDTISSGSITIDKSGNLYLSDIIGSGNWDAPNGSRIIKVNTSNQLSTVVNGLVNPVGKVIDSKGNMYVSNYYGFKVTKHTPSGQSTDYLTNLSYPSGMAIDPNDNIYVVEMFGNKITKITASGVSSTFAQDSKISWVNGLIFDDKGDLYGANWSNGSILKITPNGTVSLFAQLPVAGPANYQGSGFVAFGNNRFYATSLGTNKVYEISREGVVKILAGTGEVGYTNGDLDKAKFDQPNGIIVSNDGKKLYISETLKRRIRVIHLK